MLRCAWAIAAALAAAFSIDGALGDYAPPRYTVDLDVDPEHRWDHVAAAEGAKFLRNFRTILASPKIQKYVPAAIAILGAELEAGRLFPAKLAAEFRGIARATGADPGELAVVGALYDLLASEDSPFSFKACTGVVAQSSSGEILHGRNLDYSFREQLSAITLVIDFTHGGKTLFTAVTFGVNPVFNTAVRWGSFSVSHNERDQGKLIENLWDLLVVGRPALFGRIRSVVEHTASFGEAVDFFAKVKLAAPGYIIVGGARPGEGAVVTRNRDDAVDVQRLDVAAGAWYLVETNYDHMAPPGDRDDRRHPLKRALNATGPDGLNASSLWSVLSVTRVHEEAGERAPLNNETIYSTVMQASDPTTFVTKVREGNRPASDEFVV